MKKIHLVTEADNLAAALTKTLGELGYAVVVSRIGPAHKGVVAVMFDTRVGSPASAGLPKDRSLAAYPVVAVAPGFASLPTGIFDDVILDGCDRVELKYRLEAAIAAKAKQPASVTGFGELVINSESYEVTIAGDRVELTFKEYELLHYLASHPGRVCSRQVLLNQIWQYDYFGGTRTVDVHIRRLRSKLGTKYGACVQTVRQVGYRFSPP